MPKVSVIVPSFNHGRYLRHALETALSQTLRDLEVLVLDDGSIDDSLMVATSIEDSRLRVESNKTNLGTYGTQQRGLERTDSEFVAILNSDDFWEPCKLERQVEALEARPDCAYCYTLGWVVDADGRRHASQDVHADWPTDPVQDLLPKLLFENRVLASSVLFRRRGLRFHTECRYSGDWVVQLEAGAGRRVACVAERLTHWRVHGSNTFSRSRAQVLEEIAVRRAIATVGSGWLRYGSDSRAVRLGLGWNALNLSALYAPFHRNLDGLLAGLQAVRWHPSKRRALRRTAAALLPGPRWAKALWSGIDENWPWEQPKTIRLDLPPVRH